MFRVLTLVILLAHNVFAYNILAIISLPLRSHYMAFHPFFRELAIKGHNVTVINNFPEIETIPNLRFVDIKTPITATLSTLDFFETTSSSYHHLADFYRQVLVKPGYVKLECDHLFANKKIKELEKKLYDVIIVELFETDCALAYALHMYNAPIIGIKSHVLLPSAYAKLGLPFNIASDPFYRSNAGTNPSLQQRVENYLMNLLSTTVGSWYENRIIRRSFEEHVPNINFDLEGATKERLKMVFAYQHFSVTGARLFAPQLLEIGGIHVGKPKPVPKEIENILSKSEHGVIYVSFGTYLKPHTMSEKKLEQFYTAFKRLPHTFIWKIENMTVPAGYDNIHIGKWWPQLDVLCHPKVLGVISHGGMLTISECAHCGKPTITVPFFGDQMSNSAAVRQVGFGKTLYLSDITADSLEEAVRHLTSEKMQQNARRISKLWHDRPQPVMDSAIYWTEYVARHGQAPPSLPSKYNTWFESSLLDVYTVLILTLVGVFLILYVLLKLLKLVLVMLFKIAFGQEKRKIKEKKRK